MTELMKELIAETAPADVEKEGFVIDDMGKAMWAVDKIAEKQAELDDVNKLVEAQIEKLLEWQKKKTANIEFEINTFTTMLKPFAEKQLEGKKSKTVSLPNGSLSLGRTTKNIVKNDAEMLEYAKQNCPEFVKTEVKEKLDWTAMKKTLQMADGGVVVDANGEIVPATWDEKTSEFQVKLA